MKFKPLQDRILIRPMAEEERTAGGIIIPDTAKERPAEGEIVAVGPGLLDEDGARTPLAVKKGERVLYAKYGGTEVKIAGDDFLIVRESDILAVVEAKTGVPKKKR